MYLDFLSPIEESVFTYLDSRSSSCLGNYVQFFTSPEDFPNLEETKIAVLGVQEDRNAVNNIGCGEDLSIIRKKLYELFPGDWNTSIADIGNIKKGNTVDDTYFAVKEIITELLKNQIIPIILGGSQDLT
ncbi:arginase, partial [Polaribacter sp.]|nr:arginase [Polaribacter sp.]